MRYLPISLKRSMSHLLIKRWSFHLLRFHLTTYIKFLICLVIIYLLNLITGLHYYIWLEKSFENEYHLTMTKIDITKINEQNVEKILGPPTTFISNTFIIKNEYLCNQEDFQPDLLILVKSAIENWKARQAIRITWGQKQFLETNSIKLAFLLGTSEHNLTIEQESKQYKDIIQIDKIDFYYYNSYKMVMMLRWISKYCTSKYYRNDIDKYVLFIDDDYYLNLNSLLNYINKINKNSNMTIYERQTFLTGYVYKESRPRRFLNDRWYISIDDYSYDRYPPYVTAGCFLMTRSNAALFYLASKYIPLFRFDDIYIGILAYSMSIKLISNNYLFSSYDSSAILFNDQREFFSIWKRFFNMKNNNSDLIIQPICIHGYRGEELIHIWNKIYQTNLTLPVNIL